MAGAVLGGAVVAVALVVRASVDRSPLRYASYVTVSIAAALALVIVVNLIAQDSALYWHRDMQQLGRYGLSGRTRRILATVQSPVRLTCVYTSTDEQTRGADFRPAVLELLDDMRERNLHIEVANAASESAKARIIARLRGQLGGKAEKHIQFLTDFTQRSQEMAKSLAEEQVRWGQLGDEAYLSMWAMTAQAPQVLAKGAQEVDRLRAKVSGELSGTGLPDYAGLVGEVTKTLSEFQQELQAEAGVLAGIAKIPQAASAHRQDAIGKLDALQKTVAELSKVLAAGKAEEASQALLDRSAALARDAAAKALEAAKALQNVGGADNARLVSASRYYQLAIPSGIFEVRSDLGRFLEQYVAGSLQTMAETVEAVRKVAKPEYYGQSIGRLQTEAAELSQVVEQVTKAGRTALDKLTEVDGPSRQVLKVAQAGETFKDLLEVMASLLEQGRKLSELPSDTLATDIVGDNIVIIEAGGKTAVVPFDEVWPMKGRRSSGEEPATQGEQRIFNGDSAVTSRILAMTSEPFATVVLTYFGGPPELMRMMPSEIAPADLSVLRKRWRRPILRSRSGTCHKFVPTRLPAGRRCCWSCRPHRPCRERWARRGVLVPSTSPRSPPLSTPAHRPSS